MCIACLEYVKDRLTSAEFQSALRESTMENQNHRREVEKVLREYAQKPEELKRKLEELSRHK